MSAAYEYILSMRPWSFTAAIVPVLVTTAVVKAPLYSAEFLRCIAMAVLVQAGANLTNTYYDFINGVDGNDSGDRSLVDKKVSPGGLLILSIVCYALAMFSVLPMLIGDHSQLLIAVFSVGVVLAYFYTANPVGLKYRAMGDITIFLCFGPLLMQCTSLMLTGQSNSMVYYYTIPIGFLTEAILHGNNARDIEADKKAHATTLATIIGLENSFYFFLFLISGAYAAAFIFSIVFHWGCILSLLTIPLGADLVKKFEKNDLKNIPEDVAKAHLPFGMLLFLGVQFTSNGFLSMMMS